ncbi:DUF3347 domain-containing protein [Autumnicola edwardsiae]|nr:DUF3347 domain-containing protein [Zunongwangia sp. F297]MDT0650232.1 DUF3347 domain-containing protein [Zunongwangia sp. F297]
MAFAVISTSCKNNEKNSNTTIEDAATERAVPMEENRMESSNAAQTDASLTTYLELKNALVNDDQEAAAKAGEKMVGQLKTFKTENYEQNDQQELQDIIEDATEHAEHIAESPIGHQREHFDILSKDMIDLIDIVGTSQKLYQAYCPMYNNNKGAQWLSVTKEIKNPYYGSKMMDCGEVQREIN